jgi:hypothetical protein
VLKYIYLFNMTETVKLILLKCKNAKINTFLFVDILNKKNGMIMNIIIYLRKRWTHFRYTVFFEFQ